ncbi:MAG: hypothetical protein HZC36_02595 [Armatimonadetes bacterium]|nr:hypothetical protein [Armatimonadota bacterium]
MRKLSVLFAVSCLCAMIGCSGDEPKADTKATEPPKQTDLKPPSAPAPQGTDPGDTAITAEDLKKLQTKQESAVAALKKKPGDATLKKAYVTASLDLADKTMKSAALESTEKYPAALRIYRDVLKVDPANKEAKEWIGMIESIYQSMGKAVPK